MKPLHLNDSDFNAEVLKSDLPVLVDFWAPWCGPCKMIAPIIDELAGEYDKRVKICKLNVDDNHKIATHYGVMSIPTIIFFRNGKIMEQFVGAMSKSDLKRKIEENL